LPRCIGPQVARIQWSQEGTLKRHVVGPGLLVALAALGAAVVGAQKPIESWLTPLHFPAPEFPAATPPPAPSPATRGIPTRAGAPAQREAEPQPPADEPGRSPVFWINSPPLTMWELRGKVVLIDFWEYTCINCIRTLAENKRWYKRYHHDGFEIIGVHDPEFDIAYPVRNVEQAVRRFRLPYPVVVDNQFRIWNSYHNHTWPSRFLVDATGVVRYHRDGEGGDSAFELAIRKLLQEAYPGLKFPAADTIPPEKNAFAPSCGVPTGEMYVGDWYRRGILANPEGYRDAKTIDYKLPKDVEDGRAVLAGRWQTDKNGMIYRGKHKGNAPGEDELEMRYHARELYAVLNVSHGRPSRLYIRQDGKDLTKENRGVDVQFDSQGHSYIEVHEPRMYYLVANPAFGSHSLSLFPTRPGVTINSFTFGNSCQTDFPHL
jgi:thiol-disulfide isomerase/thioredoxin